MDPLAQWRSWDPISTTSALALRSRTVARRTVQTLMGSYVALRTSTRPPDQRPEPSELDPCRRWSSSGTDPAGAGGTAIAIRPECRQWVRRPRRVPGAITGHLPEPGWGRPKVRGGWRHNRP